MSWIGDLVTFLITSGLLGIVARYIKKSSGQNIFAKGFWAKDRYQEQLKKEIDRTTELYKEMDYFRDTFNLKSIDIVEFHNGDYINARSVQKYTMTSQMCRVGVPETMHLYQDKPLEGQYGLLNLYKQREGNVVVTDKENLPKDSPPLFLEKMMQLKITGYVALGLFANKEDVYPRAIISCVLDEEAKRDGLDVELNMHSDKLKALVLSGLKP
jgi:hypothetical protein